MKSTRAFLSAWAPPALYMAAIFFFSGQSTPAAIKPMLDVVKDKTLHAIEYGLLTLLLVRAARLQFPRACPLRVAVYCALAASLYGLSDEWHQVYVPSRTADLGDWIADTAGAALAAGLYLFYCKRRYGGISACPLPPSRGPEPG